MQFNSSPIVSLNAVSTGTGTAYAINHIDKVRAAILFTGTTLSAGKVILECAKTVDFAGIWSFLDEIAYNDTLFTRSYDADLGAFIRARVSTTVAAAANPAVTVSFDFYTRD